MGKTKKAQAERKEVPKSISPKVPGVTRPEQGFKLHYPLLWIGLAALLVYAQTIWFGFTELDDSIFIREFHAYNEDIRNLLTSFQRGVFDAIKDPYYRPLFLDSMILNFKLSDDGQNIVSYHFINILLHVGSCLLLYRLLLKLQVREVVAFLLTLIFAVHPVLSQAVAWIPGRNDTLLAIFCFSFLNQAIEFSNSGKELNFLLSGLFLLLAFFTKETAVFIPPVAFLLIVVMLQKNWRANSNWIQYALWVSCFMFWFVVRAFAVASSSFGSPGQLVSGFVTRLPLVVQYFGKVFLPVNLSVFPIQEDTVYYYGVIAILVVGLLVFLNKKRNIRVLVCGLGVFFLFLLPVLIVPNNLNDQTFEHRLYLPMVGILLILSQVVSFDKINDRSLNMWGIGIAGVLAVVNIQHQKYFADPLVFWTQAAETSPHSAYANMMLAAREPDQKDAYARFRKAYQLNPKEKYLNYYYGVMLQKQDSVAASEKYLLAEKNSSGYYECDFYLARVAMERKDLPAAINYLKTYVSKDQNNKIANTNLLLMYLDTKQIDNARAQAQHMRQMGLDVPPQVLSQLGL